jgi:hypothetical protein
MNKLLNLFVAGDDEPPKKSAAPEELPDLPDMPTGGTDAWAQFEKMAANKSGKPLSTAVAQQAGPNLDQVSVKVDPPVAGTPVNEFVLPKKKPDNTWDFTPVYSASNLVPGAFSAEQALEIIRSMPAELPMEVRRKTVGASIGTLGKTLGVTPESIAADAALKIAAIQDFQSKVDGNFAEYANKANSAIAEYERKIAELKNSIQNAQGKSSELKNACIEEIDRLDDVTEFFTLDIGSSKYAQPTAVAQKEPAPASR